MHAFLLTLHLCYVMVKPGNTLSGIAANNATTWRHLASLNPQIVNVNLIYPGERIDLCGQQMHLVSIPNAHMADLSKLPCHGVVDWPSGYIGLWTIPDGCYAGLYRVNRGDCFGWVKYLLPDANFWRGSSQPKVGDAVHFRPGLDGAGDSGHWAYVVAIKDRWLLISEENMHWRGGGYNIMNYRYVRLTSGMLFYH